MAVVAEGDAHDDESDFNSNVDFNIGINDDFEDDADNTLPSIILSLLVLETMREWGESLFDILNLVSPLALVLWAEK